jgi:hypothetical protein
MPLKRVFGLVLAASISWTIGARAEPSLTKDQCISENEAGQDARMAGRLYEAETRFRSCMVESCPAPLREDCLRRLEDVRRAAPTLVFVIKDEAGRVLSNATISMDGAPIGLRQEGAIVRADPGTHTFEFVANGYTPLTKTILLEEHVVGREVPIVLTNAVPVAVSRPAEERSVVAQPSSTNLQRTISFVLMGAGAVGLGLGGVSTLVASGAHDDALAACHDRKCIAGSDGIEREKTAQGWANVATVSLVAGAALAVGGLILFFTSPKSPSRSAVGWR